MTGRAHHEAPSTGPVTNAVTNAAVGSEPGAGSDARTGIGPGPAPGGDGVVILDVVRDGPLWVTRGSGDGVVVCGRTLDRLQRSAQAALALRSDGDGVPVEVRLLPRSADLDLLAAAREPYQRALRAAVGSLRAAGASWADIAVACEVPASQAQAVFGEADRC